MHSTSLSLAHQCSLSRALLCRTQREAAEKRMRAKEAEAAKQRALDAKKKEQHRQLAAKLHEETMARAAEERAQAEESKRMADERKAAKLRQRLEDEKEALLERNLRKAEEAAEKVERAAIQRIEAQKVSAYHHQQQHSRFEQCISSSAAQRSRGSISSLPKIPLTTLLSLPATATSTGPEGTVR